MGDGPPPAAAAAAAAVVVAVAVAAAAAQAPSLSAAVTAARSSEMTDASGALDRASSSSTRSHSAWPAAAKALAEHIRPTFDSGDACVLPARR